VDVAANKATTRFHALNGGQGQLGPFGQVNLGDGQERSSSAKLLCGNHVLKIIIHVLTLINKAQYISISYSDEPLKFEVLTACGDGSAFVATMAQSNQRTDVLLVDAFDRQGIAPAVTERGFLEDARRVLSKRGIFVMNIVATVAACKRYLDTIRSVFGGPVIAVNVESGANVVVFAGRPLRNRRSLVIAPLHAQHIEGRLGLSFPTLLQLTRELQYQLSQVGPPRLVTACGSPRQWTSDL
jgi:hypothetical protein